MTKDEQLDEFFKDRCDYRNGDNEDGTYYDSCTECYRYDICKKDIRLGHISNDKYTM